MSRHDVYIIGGASTKFTYRPVEGFEKMAYNVMDDILEKTKIYPGEIDDFRLASMVPGGFGTESGEITSEIANKKRLINCRKIRPVEATSSTGGEALSDAYEAVAYNPKIKNSLVVGCELMGYDKEILRKILSGAVGKRERELSFEMMHEGDLLMSPLVEWFGLSDSALSKHVLSRIAIKKQDREDWEGAQFEGDRISFRDYKKCKSVTKRLKLYDVVPTSNGACAILLSKYPPKTLPNGRIVRIRGSGQGTDRGSVSDREGPIDYFRSIRLSYKYACEDAGVSLEYLKKTLEDNFAFIHDAFPSIEIAFLKELGFDKDEIVKLIISGKTNPYGGLKKCGHAIGASGILQAIQAYKKFCDGKGNRSFTTSVGGPLTNVYTTILEARDIDGEFPKLSNKEIYNEARFKKYLKSDGEYKKILESLTAEKGKVIANTMVNDNHVNLVQLGPTDIKELAYSAKEIDLNTFVDIELDEGVHKVTAVYRRLPHIRGSLRRFSERQRIKREAKNAFEEPVS